MVSIELNMFSISSSAGVCITSWKNVWTFRRKFCSIEEVNYKRKRRTLGVEISRDDCADGARAHSSHVHTVSLAVRHKLSSFLPLRCFRESSCLKSFSTVTELHSKEEAVLTLKGVGFKVTGSYGVTGSLACRYVRLSWHRNNVLTWEVSYWLDEWVSCWFTEWLNHWLSDCMS